MKEIDSNRVAIYIRWSTDDQGDGTTLDVQLDGCKHYVLSQGWQVNDSLTFVDEGYSGGNLERPGMTKLRKLVKLGKVDCVVVFKVDRLSRSVIDTVNLVLEEWDGRTYLKSAREPIDTTTAMGKQFFYMLVSYAEWERSVIRERTVSGRRRRAQEGYKPSAMEPFGYRHSPTRRGALEIVESEAEIVREIFRLSNTGLGSKAVCTILNDQGIRYRGGKLWADKTIAYMVQNRLYVGDMVYGKTTRNPRYGKEPGELSLIRTTPLVVENSDFIPPIITREEFQLAGEMQAKRQRGPGKPSGRANSSPYLLTGLARCRCGYALFGRVVTGNRRINPGMTYLCLGRRQKGNLQCDCAPIPMKELDAEIERRVRERYGGAAAQEAFMQRMIASQSAEKRLWETELAEVNRQLAELEEQEKKVRRDYRSDRITAEEYRELKGEIEKETADFRSRLQGLETAIAEGVEKARGNLLVQEQLTRVDQWERLEDIEKKHVLRFFIDKLVVYRTPGQQEIDLDIAWVTTGQG